MLAKPTRISGALRPLSSDRPPMACWRPAASSHPIEVIGQTPISTSADPPAAFTAATTLVGKHHNGLSTAARTGFWNERCRHARALFTQKNSITLDCFRGRRRLVAGVAGRDERAAKKCARSSDATRKRGRPVGRSARFADLNSPRRIQLRTFAGFTPSCLAICGGVR